MTPRNLLQDETEKTALLYGLIEVLLPTISGMEECVKCCDHCYKNGTQRLDDPQFLIQSINKACGEMVARLPDAGKPAAAAAAAAAPPSPALSPVAEMVGEAEPKRKRAGLGERDPNAHDASPAAPPQLDRAGDENDSSVAAVQQQKQLKVAAQHAKSKEKKRREKYQATAAVREEQNSKLSQRIMELTAENDRLHSFKREAQTAAARVRELERAADLETGDSDVVGGLRIRPEDRAQIEMELRLKIAEEEEEDTAAKSTGSRTELSGVKLKLKTLGHNSRHWASEQTRMTCANAHTFGGVALDDCLPNLVTSLTAFGIIVEPGLSDSTEVTIGGITEAHGMIRWQLALDVARCHAPEFEVPAEPPTPAAGAAVAAHPAADDATTL